MRFFSIIFIFFMILILFKIPQKIRIFWQNFLNSLNPPKKTPFHSKNSDPKILDEMKACHTCGTYVPSQMAFYFKEQFYCSQQCLVKAKRKS